MFADVTNNDSTILIREKIFKSIDKQFADNRLNTFFKHQSRLNHNFDHMKVIMTDLIISQLSSILFFMSIKFNFNVFDDFAIDVENKDRRIKQKKRE